MTDQPPPRICGVILAGGLARRMGGGEKYLLPLAGATILDHVIERARPQVDQMAFNGPALPDGLDLPLVPDVWPDEGPLGGILSSLAWAAGRDQPPDHVLSLAADTPFFPKDLAAGLAEAAGPAPARATSLGRQHGVFSLWPLTLLPAVQGLFEEGERSVNRALEALDVADVAFPASPFDPFFNINTPDDLREAARLAGILENRGP